MISRAGFARLVLLSAVLLLVGTGWRNLVRTARNTYHATWARQPPPQPHLWGNYTTLAQLCTERLLNPQNDNLATLAPQAPPTGKFIDEEMLEGVSPACHVNTLEQGYWRSRAESPTKFLALPLGPLWCHHKMAVSSLAGCVHHVQPCSEVQLNATGPSASTSTDLTVRPLGSVCPSVEQLNASFVLPSADRLNRSILVDFFNTTGIYFGDSIMLGSGSYGATSFRNILAGWGEDLVAGMPGVSVKPQCMAAASGLAVVAVAHPNRRLKRKLKICLRAASSAVVMLGTNDFLFNQNASTYTNALKKTFTLFLEHGVGRLTLVVPPIPVGGRRWEPTGGDYAWPSHITDVVQRAAAAGRRLRLTDKQGSVKMFSRLMVVDANNALRWCAEHNYADGTHPNLRGHFLIALEFLRTMMASSG
eukprot:TRINITY_DN4950_c0_g1_i1.p1 TRINITY_DN4950_c0_g1~~TRINITY_DN4950_c0_g1_i1.p1  ORF type:complete len:419 (+),score=24.26 TRINITY_DN4950_c0_g1_i1:221-1477(+)